MQYKKIPCIIQSVIFQFGSVPFDLKDTSERNVIPSVFMQWILFIIDPK